MLLIKSISTTLAHNHDNWRRGRDSNPRYLAAHPISSRAHSTTLTLSLTCIVKIPLIWQTFNISRSNFLLFQRLPDSQSSFWICYMIRTHSRYIFLLITIFTFIGCKSSHHATVDFADGSYSGSLGKGGKKNGKGVYRWLDGSIYEGEYKRHEAWQRPFYVGKWRNLFR